MNNPIRFIDPDGQSVFNNPFQGFGEGIARAFRGLPNRVGKTFEKLGKKFINSLKFNKKKRKSNRGGYDISGGNKEGIAKKDVAADRTKVDIIDAGEVLEMITTVYGPQTEGATEAAKLVSDL